MKPAKTADYDPSDAASRLSPFGMAIFDARSRSELKPPPASSE